MDMQPAMVGAKKRAASRVFSETGKIIESRGEVWLAKLHLWEGG
jgi:hypothetical protein